VAALLKRKNARKSFLKTRHDRLIFIDDLLGKNGPTPPDNHDGLLDI
jgi:hypothetical protein